jgi:hypothetical protein
VKSTSRCCSAAFVPRMVVRLPHWSEPLAKAAKQQEQVPQLYVFVSGWLSGFVGSVLMHWLSIFACRHFAFVCPCSEGSGVICSRQAKQENTSSIGIGMGLSQRVVWLTRKTSTLVVCWCV